VLYGLRILAVSAIVLGYAGVLSYGGTRLLLSLVLIVSACMISNAVFSKLWKVPANSESSIITGLILFFLISPVFTAMDAAYLALAGVIAMGSKYVLAVRGKHLFNPAAFAAVALFFTGSAIWWIGTVYMLPLTLIIGLLIVRKTRRVALFAACILASFLTAGVLGMQNGLPIGEALLQHLLSWPIVFFGSIMVTEPLTMPPRRMQQIIYGVLIGIFSSWPIVMGPMYATPELVLVLANLYSYSVSLRRRLILTLSEKKEIARETYEFIFDHSLPLAFLPGQYLEWTLPQPKPDNRGNRRYFTVASSPTELTIHLGIKLGQNVSSFKRALKEMKKGDVIYAGQLSGDFTLPKNAQEKLVFIAGGIGITPFRSMIKYLIDKDEKRDIVLLYGNRTPADVAYRDLLQSAEKSIGLTTVYAYSDPLDPFPAGAIKTIDAALIKERIPDYKDRTYYLSGPTGMVDAFKNMLTGMGVHRAKIVTDYFPGFA
jgi:glycine betaine catabolism B